MLGIFSMFLCAFSCTFASYYLSMEASLLGLGPLGAGELHKADIDCLTVEVALELPPGYQSMGIQASLSPVAFTSMAASSGNETSPTDNYQPAAHARHASRNLFSGEVFSKSTALSDPN